MIITSKYYGTKEVKEFNDKIAQLEKEAHVMNYCDNSVVDEIICLLKYCKPYEKLSDYVPNSAKYKEILNGIEQYEFSQKRLAEHKHKSEVVVDECNPKSLRIYKHTYVRITHAQLWDDEGFVYGTVPVESEMVFFTLGSYYDEGKLVEDFSKLYLPYVCETGLNKDLIAETLRELKAANTQVLMYRFAEYLDIKYADLCNIFGENNLMLNAKFIGGFNYNSIELNNKQYRKNTIHELLSDYKILKEKKFVKEDKFIEYPRSTHYLKMLEQIANGEFSVYEEIPE